MPLRDPFYHQAARGGPQNRRDPWSQSWAFKPPVLLMGAGYYQPNSEIAKRGGFVPGGGFGGPGGKRRLFRPKRQQDLCVQGCLDPYHTSLDTNPYLKEETHFLDQEKNGLIEGGLPLDGKDSLRGSLPRALIKKRSIGGKLGPKHAAITAYDL